MTDKGMDKSRRAAQLSVQRLLHAGPPPPPPYLPPDLATNAGRQESLRALPAFLSLWCSSAYAAPSCVACASELSWSDWAHDAQPLGLGAYAARCAACLRLDAPFKDGP